MSFPTQTVGDLKKMLADLPDDLPLIYSHDDEGNEFQYVISGASIAYVKKSKGYRFLETGASGDKNCQKDVVKCVCIN